MKNQEIAEAAYYKWEKAGRPEGQQDRFWYLAEKEISVRDNFIKFVAAEKSTRVIALALGRFRNLPNLFQVLATACGVTSKHTLSDTNLSPQLTKFLDILHKFNCKQQHIADILNEIGVTSASGLTVSNSHVSNTLRKALKTRTIQCTYCKPKYSGRNHHTG